MALHGLVRSGQGREQTASIYRHLRSNVENARLDAQSFPEIQKHQAHLDAAAAVIAELDRYYGYGA